MSEADDVCETPGCGNSVGEFGGCCRFCGRLYCDECGSVHDACCLECLELHGPPEEDE